MSVCLLRGGYDTVDRTILFNFVSLQKLEIKKNLREFSGFTFDKESDQYKKKKVSLGK